MVNKMLWPLHVLNIPEYLYNRYFLSVFFLLAVLQLEAQEKFPNDTAAAFKYLQERGEVYFSFEASSKEVSRLSRIVSVDSYRDGIAFAYANRKEFDAFLEESLEFTVYSPPGEWHRELPSLKGEWNYYPSYEEYTGMMQAWSSGYSHICEYIDAGPTTEGRRILFLKITGDKTASDPKPAFMYSSTMHGDETVGFILMLRLVEYLLVNYPRDPQVEMLMDNLEIWINPLANPDGSYFGGDGNEIISPKRNNANNIDLNRNFPEPGISEYLWNEAEAETAAMIKLMDSVQFILSANLHGGTEVMNYPWDYRRERHADDGWFEYICREYADTAQRYSPPNYMTFLGGVTNGYDWYPITGGRQDYVTWFTGGREITMEISETKHPPAGTLSDYWEYNRRSLLNYMEQALYGLRGEVYDAVTGDPVKARVEILSHDSEHSHIYSDPSTGWYFRLIEQGVYDIIFSSPGYLSDTLSVSTWNREISRHDVSLDQEYTFSPFQEDGDEDVFNAFFSPADHAIITKVNLPASTTVSIGLYDYTGRKVRVLYHGLAEPGPAGLSFDAGGIGPGIYIVRIRSSRMTAGSRILVFE